MFEKKTFQAIDALVVFIPKGQKASKEVQRILNETGASHHYIQNDVVANWADIPGI